LIPYPELTQRYVRLSKANSAERLREAEQATVCEYARLVCDSVRAFDRFEVDPSEPFYPESDARDSEKSPESDARTFGWAKAIRETQPEVSVDGDTSLDFRYVAREVIPAHTKPRRAFEVEGGLFNSADLILANAQTKRPIVAELKIAGDKDPFTALVQALAAAAQLVPLPQRDRLACNFEGALSRSADQPVVDVYVLLASFPLRNRDRWFQLAYARGLACGLESHPAVRKHLGRITLLTLDRSGANRISASTTLPVPEGRA
jgi:hypothetical protein